MKAFLWYTLQQGYNSLIRLVVLALIGLLGLSAVTVQTPNELVGSIKDTVKVVGEVDLAIDEVGGFDEFLKRANDWLERELAK